MNSLWWRYPFLLALAAIVVAFVWSTVRRLGKDRWL
jgi:hypothetical protein